MQTPAPNSTVPDLMAAYRNEGLPERYERVRAQTEAICRPLKTEDYVIQSMTDASPTKWHLAHTTWFFETFVLRKFSNSYVPIDDRYAYLFNSYYVQAGARFARPHRGMLSRPTVEEVYAYRSHVDSAMAQLLAASTENAEIISVVEIGLNHEQQHQELLVTDLKHVLSLNPLYPAHESNVLVAADRPVDLSFVDVDEGICDIGHRGPGFFYDNEGPAHRQFVEGYGLANRPVLNGEYLEFMLDGGYDNPLVWLSEGWTSVQQNAWTQPIYWIREGDEWSEFSLFGKIPLDPYAPLSHISYFEADAFARWSGLRLPTEFEWENVARNESMNGHYSESMHFHPRLGETSGSSPFVGLYGGSWEWTSSHYSPYPGYRPVDGALGEYNGKFMSNQFVLRGGSCATPSDHMRASYRNFFPSYARWQFAGIRLAKSSS